MGVYVKAGSRYETVPGTSYVVERTAFRTTQHRTALKVARDMEEAGATINAKTGPEIIAYTGESLRNALPAVLDTLGETIVAPKLYPWEITEAVHEQETVAELTASNPANLVNSGIHGAAFGSVSNLGRPVYPGKDAVHHITGDTLRTYLGNQYTGSNIVVTGTNIAHSELASLAEGILGTVPQGSTATSTKTTYTGGEALYRTDGDVAHVSIALSAPNKSSPNHHTVGVLKTLLGSKSVIRSTSNHTTYARQSRLNKVTDSSFATLSAFSVSYSDAGLIGITGSTSNTDAGKLVNVAVRTFKELVAAPVSSAELERAKQAYKLAYALNIDSSAGNRDSLGSQLLYSGKVASVKDTFATIDAITVNDITTLVKNSLASPVSISATGSLAYVPRYDVVNNLLK